LWCFGMTGAWPHVDDAIGALCPWLVLRHSTVDHRACESNKGVIKRLRIPFK
jgi:hypothetical protein